MTEKKDELNNQETQIEQTTRADDAEENKKHHHRRRTIIIVLLSVCIVLCITACAIGAANLISDEEEETQEASVEQQADEQETGDDENEKVTIEVAPNDDTDSTESATDDSDTTDDADDETECSHDWSITYETVHHDAETHTVNVPAEYEDETSYHTVCNQCNEVIDGEAVEHLKETGHSGYTRNVPITNTVLVKDAYSYEVTDTPAYDELVADEMVCTLCGETRDL